MCRLAAELAAGGFDVAAELAADGDVHALVLQYFDEGFEGFGLRRPELPLLNVVERDEVD